jgi:hypothetical protein
MDLRDTALLLITERSYQRDHIQPKLSMRQRPTPFFLRSRWLMEARTLFVSASVHFERETCDPL